MPVALITGSGRRLGAVMADVLACKGYDLALHCHASIADAKDLCVSLKNKYPDQRFAFFSHDLMEHDGPSMLYEQAMHAFGSIDLILNNASIFHYDTLATCTIQAIRSHMRLHVEVPLLLAQKMQSMVPSGSIRPTASQIINMIDGKIYHPTGHYLSYGLSKSALFALTKNLALDLAPHVRVNGIAPGFVLRGDQETDLHFNEQCERTPMGCATSLEDLKNALCFLIDAHTVTGQCLVLDSGRSLMHASFVP